MFVCRSFEEVSGCRNWDSEIGHVLRNPRVRNVYKTPIFTRARPVVKLSNITLPWHSIHSRGIATQNTAEHHCYGKTIYTENLGAMLLSAQY